MIYFGLVDALPPGSSAGKSLCTWISFNILGTHAGILGQYICTGLYDFPWFNYTSL